MVAKQNWLVDVLYAYLGSVILHSFKCVFVSVILQFLAFIDNLSVIFILESHNTFGVIWSSLTSN